MSNAGKYSGDDGLAGILKIKRDLQAIARRPLRQQCGKRLRRATATQLETPFARQPAFAPDERSTCDFALLAARQIFERFDAEQIEKTFGRVIQGPTRFFVGPFDAQQLPADKLRKDGAAWFTSQFVDLLFG